MGIEDRDWFRQAQRERQKQQQIDDTRARFAAFSGQHLARKPASPPQTGLLGMMLFWCVVMGLLYLLMTHYLKPRQPQVLANGDLVIQRASDGHFYAPGSVNGQPVTFMVDTGASLVSVSDALARQAGLHGGSPTTFNTANGSRAGRVVEGVQIVVGPLSVSQVRVGVGLRLGDDNQALLGQSFLSKFDLIMDKNKMVLRSR